MKKFENPAVEVELFSVEDIITTSGNPNCPDETANDCIVDG